MHFSAQEEYGLRCMLRLAAAGMENSLTIPEISQAEGISIPYAAKIMRALREGRLVNSERGASGGYRVARPADQIPVSEVLAVLGSRLFTGEFCEKFTGNEDHCAHSINCSIRSLWRAVQKVVDQLLSQTTLKDLLRNEQAMDVFVNDLVVLAASSVEAAVPRAEPFR
jgi:Rrf2 family protein